MIEVHGVDENDDSECVCARAESLLRRRSGGALPLGYRSFKEVARKDR